MGRRSLTTKPPIHTTNTRSEMDFSFPPTVASLKRLARKAWAGFLSAPPGAATFERKLSKSPK